MRVYRYSSVRRGQRLPVSSLLLAAVCLALVAPAGTARAGFASDEVFLPAVGRITGGGGSAQFYTTVWATNLSGAPITFTFQFLKQGQANTSPASFNDSLAAGQTKVYENVVEDKLGLTSVIGAARIFASGPILISERIYNQAPGADIGDTEGLFFAGVPQAFSIHAGETASIQGVNQGDGENFRYNFALVETGGFATTVNVQVLDGFGVLLGQHSYPLSPFEQLQPNVADIVPSIATTNARITATVTAGSGAVLLAGAQLANVSQDSSGFEMSFKGSLLGGGGGAVVHDATLTGDGTGGSPLGLAIPLTLASGLLKFQIFPNAAVAFYAQSDETSNSGVAIWGQGRDIGVYGQMVDASHDTVAWGELGRSASGQSYGVVAGSFDPNGSAMLAQYVGTPPGTAIELQNGAMKVSGGNPTAFVHVATELGYITTISNPLTDGDPNAILIVTHTYNPPEAPGGNLLNRAYSVYYAAPHWTIYLDDQSTPITGATFNVLVIKRPAP
jgi:hypothetical protein